MPLSDRRDRSLARLRPSTLDEVIGQRHLVAPGAPLRTLVEQDRVSSAILWGPPGSGKTTLALAVAAQSEKEFVTLQAVSAGVADVREAIASAKTRLGEHRRGTILFIDEVHRFNRGQQDALLPAVEAGLVVLIGATTENPYSASTPRCSAAPPCGALYRLEDEDIRRIVEEGSRRSPSRGIPRCGGRAGVGSRRRRPSGARDPRGGGCPRSRSRGAVSRSDVDKARAGRLVHHGRDDHYDMVSALIKSVRGSDRTPGSTGWHDFSRRNHPLFPARVRLVILASEDVGMADPSRSWSRTPPPEPSSWSGCPRRSSISLRPSYICPRPQSRTGSPPRYARALEDVRRGPRTDVPTHLRDSHYRGAAALGHGDGYEYPHDDPTGWIEQEYRPPEVAGHVYYEPGDHGAESAVAKRLAELRSAGRRRPRRNDAPGTQGDALGGVDRGLSSRRVPGRFLRRCGCRWLGRSGSPGWPGGFHCVGTCGGTASATQRPSRRIARREREAPGRSPGRRCSPATWHCARQILLRFPLSQRRSPIPPHRVTSTTWHRVSSALSSGPRKSRIAATVRWLEERGLGRAVVDSDHLSVSFRATALQIESAFGIGLERYERVLAARHDSRRAHSRSYGRARPRRRGSSRVERRRRAAAVAGPRSSWSASSRCTMPAGWPG